MKSSKWHLLFNGRVGQCIHEHIHAHRCMSSFFFLFGLRESEEQNPCLMDWCGCCSKLLTRWLSLRRGWDWFAFCMCGRWHTSKEEFKNIICLFLFQGMNITHAFLGTCMALKIFEYMNKWINNFRDSPNLLLLAVFHSAIWNFQLAHK